MMDMFIKYYQKNVTLNALVFRHMKFLNLITRCTLLLFVFSSILLALGIILSLLTLHMVFSWITIVLWGACLCIMCMAAFVFNKKAKVIIKERYGIQSKKGAWQTEEFFQYQFKCFQSQLVSFNLYHVGKIEFLITLIEKEISRRKPKEYIASGVYITLFVPLWVQFLAAIYKGIHVKPLNLAEEVIIFVGIGIGILVAVQVWGKYKEMFAETIELFRNNESQSLSQIIKMSESLLLKLKSEERGTEK
ncbi:hypothetical protein [Paenibacillus sp. SER-28]